MRLIKAIIVTVTLLALLASQGIPSPLLTGEKKTFKGNKVIKGNLNVKGSTTVESNLSAKGFTVGGTSPPEAGSIRWTGTAFEGYDGSAWAPFLGAGGVLGIASGGTGGTATPTAGAIAYGTGTAYGFSAAGTAGQALISGGTGAPTWFAPTAGSVLFTGAGGALAQDNANFFWDNTNKRLGVGIATPHSRFHSPGSFATRVDTITRTVTLGDTHHIVLCDASAGAITINLPTAADISGRQYIVKKIDSSANACTIDPAGTETIDGAATLSLTARWRVRGFVSNGANWFVISN